MMRMRSFTPNRSPARSLAGRLAGPVFLAVALAILSVSQACADNLDAALLKHAPEVIEYLGRHNCRNVGILKFRVHKAGHTSSFKVGPINDNLAERLEMALIHVDPSSTPIGIIHNTDHVAASRKLPGYETPAGQRALFEQAYPLAWGSSQVRPDLMLTGVVTVRADLKSVKVQIESFGPDSPKQDKVASFDVSTDRSLLADLNEGFQISSRQLKRKTRSIELDDDAVSDAAEDNARPTTRPDSPAPKDAPASSPDNLLSYEIRYDNVPQPVTSDPASPGELHVPSPREGQVISFYLKPLASERLGLVLMVNGKNTLYEEDLEPIKCKAWVLDPGHEYGIYGFQVDNNTRKPFRVLSASETTAATYGPNTGLIQFHIFKSGTASGIKEVAGGDANPADGDLGQPMNISLRGLHQAGKTRSLSELKALIKTPKTAPKQHKTRGLDDRLIGADSTAVEGAIQNDEVKDPVFVQSIVVRYYQNASGAK
jgi:hypothetical protein